MILICKISIIINKILQQYNDNAKRIKITADNISKAKDKQYVFYTYELMLKSLYDYKDIATKIFFDKTCSSFTLSFTLKICKTEEEKWSLLLDPSKIVSLCKNATTNDMQY